MSRSYPPKHLIKPPKLSGEEWRPITYNGSIYQPPGSKYKQFYLISNFGRVWSNGRITEFEKITRDGRKQIITSNRQAEPRLLKLHSLDKDGYYIVSLFSKSGEMCCCRVHQLVAYEFIGICPQGKEVRHRDGIKIHCCINNLRYSTPKRNGKDRIKHGHQVRGEAVIIHKLREKDIPKIHKLYFNKKWSQQQIADRYNVWSSTISSIVRKKTWKHVT